MDAAQWHQRTQALWLLRKSAGALVGQRIQSGDLKSARLHDWPIPQRWAFDKREHEMNTAIGPVNKRDKAEFA